MVSSERTLFASRRGPERFMAFGHERPTSNVQGREGRAPRGADRSAQLERSAKMRHEEFAEFNGVAGGQVRPFRAGEARELGKVFKVDTGNISLF